MVDWFAVIDEYCQRADSLGDLARQKKAEVEQCRHEHHKKNAARVAVVGELNPLRQHLGFQRLESLSTRYDSLAFNLMMEGSDVLRLFVEAQAYLRADLFALADTSSASAEDLIVKLEREHHALLELERRRVQEEQRAERLRQQGQLVQQRLKNNRRAAQANSSRAKQAAMEAAQRALRYCPQ